MSFTMTSSVKWLVVLNLLGNLFFSGMIFGWGSLMLIFEQDHVFERGCHKTESDDKCRKQENLLTAMYTAASTAQPLVSFGCGYLVDKMGPRVSNIACFCILTTGSLILALAGPENRILFFGFCLVGIGGILHSVNTYPVSFIIEKRRMPIFLSSANCLFDASAVMGLLLYLIYKHLNVSRAGVFIGYAFLSLFTHIPSYFLWAPNEHSLNQQKNAANKPSEDIPNTENITKHNENNNDYPDTNNNHNNEYSNDPNADDGNDDTNQKPRHPIQSKTFTQQLKTREFRFVLFAFCLSVFKSNIYLGTNGLLLRSLGDKKRDYIFTQIFQGVLPCSVLFVPYIEKMMRVHGFLYSFRVVSALGIIYSIITLIPNLEVQCIAAFVYTNYRAIFYSVFGTYMAHTFGPGAVGRIFGAVMIFVAIFNLLQIPALLITNDYLDGDLKWLNLLMVLFVIPVAIATEMMKRSIKDTPGAEIKQPRRLKQSESRTRIAVASV
eukprot:c8122_g1_i2.p1 GENE.c8122_g1_i2~~c8122_g1_i2.p1  ORF type:complete len:507 (+),score=119.46 c8122_g1_i2:43-1521(+)